MLNVAMVMELVGAPSVDDQGAFGAISPTCLTCLTRVLKKDLTEGTDFLGVEGLMWIVAINSLMNATSKHVPCTMPYNTSCQVAVAFVVLMGFGESNLFSEASCDHLLELSEGC